MPRLPAPPNLALHPLYVGLSPEARLTFYDTVQSLPQTAEISDFLAWLSSDPTAGGERWKKVRRWLRHPSHEREAKSSRNAKVSELEAAIRAVRKVPPPLPQYDLDSPLPSPTPSLTDSEGSVSSEEEGETPADLFTFPEGAFVTACGRSFSPTPAEIREATKTVTPGVDEQTANFHIMQRSPELRAKTTPPLGRGGMPKLVIPTRTGTVRSTGWTERPVESPRTSEMRQVNSVFHLSPRGERNPLATHIRGLREGGKRAGSPLAHGNSRRHEPPRTVPILTAPAPPPKRGVPTLMAPAPPPAMRKREPIDYEAFYRQGPGAQADLHRANSHRLNRQDYYEPSVKNDWVYPYSAI